MERLVPLAHSKAQPELPAHEGAGDSARPPDCNFLHLLANSAAATDAYLKCEAALATGRLSRQHRELIALTVAEINGSKYGLSAHYAAAKAAGLTDQNIQLARKASATDPKTTALLRFTRAVTLQRGDVSDADFQPLRSVGFDDAEIPEIVANIAHNIFADYFNSVVRSAVDFPLLQPGADCPTTPAPARVPKELSI